MFALILGLVTSTSIACDDIPGAHYDRDGSYYDTGYGRGGYDTGYYDAAPAGMVYVDGYFDVLRFSWVPGYWRPAHRAGYTWVGGYYTLAGTWVPGYWRALAPVYHAAPVVVAPAPRVVVGVPSHRRGRR